MDGGQVVRAPLVIEWISSIGIAAQAVRGKVAPPGSVQALDRRRSQTNFQMWPAPRGCSADPDHQTPRNSMRCALVPECAAGQVFSLSIGACVQALTRRNRLRACCRG